MPKVKVKMDFTKVKQFLFEKGERVALGVCGGIALLLIVFTFMGALSFGKPPSGSSWQSVYDSETTKLRNMNNAADTTLASADPEEKKKRMAARESGPIDWLPVVPTFLGHPLFQLPEKIDTKWRHPFVLPLRPERFDVGFVQGGYFAYTPNPGKFQVDVFKGGAGMPGVGPGPMPGVGPRPPMGGMLGGMPMGGVGGDAGLVPVKTFKPVRMAVISGVFPMKEQLEQYRLALRFSALAELTEKPELLPQPVGLIVWRAKKPASGDWSKATSVKIYDVEEKDKKSTGKPIVNPAFKETREFFQFGMFDTVEPHMYAPHVVGGLMTPLPLFANIEPPVIKLNGIAVDEAVRKGDVIAKKDGPMGGPPPMGPGGILGKPPPKGGVDDPAPEGVATEPVDWSKFPLQKDRFEGKLNPFPTKFELLGIADPGKGAGAEGPMGGPIGGPKIGGPPPRPGERGPMDPMGGAPGAWPAAGAGDLPDDALVRFIDADVKPGETYKYYIQVRMANPLYKHEKESAYKELAAAVELVGKIFWEVPVEVTVPGEFAYYVVDEAPMRFVRDGSDDPKTKKANDTHIAMQVHRWTPEADGITIGDWAIAERLLIRKGEYIGRETVQVEVPVWKDTHNAFELVARAGAAKKKKGGAVSGIGVDFQGDYSHGGGSAKKYALVDFEGGHLRVVRGAAPLIEDTDVRALILGPDGALTVHSASADKNNAERTKRVESWKRRVRNILNPPAAAVGPMGPGGPPPMR